MYRQHFPELFDEGRVPPLVNTYAHPEIALTRPAPSLGYPMGKARKEVDRVRECGGRHYQGHPTQPVPSLLEHDTDPFLESVVSEEPPPA